MPARRLLVNGLAVLILIMLWAPLSCSSPSVDVGGIGMDVKIGFGERFRSGTWVPVNIQITNEGIPLEARIEAIVTLGHIFASQPIRVVYRRPASLPSGTRKRFILNVPIYHTATPIDIRLVEPDGSILTQRRVSLREAGVTSDIVLVLDTTGEQWNWLHEVVRTRAAPHTRVWVAHARSDADLPHDWVAYESVRTIILTASFPIASLAMNQVHAILDWVEAGGHLLVAGGPGLNVAAVPELAKRLPVELADGSKLVTLQNMGVSFAPLPAPVHVLTRKARLRNGSVDIEADGIPLIAHTYVGTGRITYVGLDLAAGPLRGWEDFDRFSRFLVFPPRMVRRATASLERTLFPLLGSQQIRYPRHIWLAAFLLAYGLGMAGALRLARHRPRGWIALPVMALLGTLYVQLLAQRYGQQSLRAYAEIRVSQVAPAAGRASSLAVAGMVRMQGGDWVLVRDSGVHLAPAANAPLTVDDLLVIEHGDEESLIGPNQPGRLLAVTTQWLEDLPVRVSLERDWQNIGVTLDNQTPWRVRNAFYVDRERYAYLGDAPPGESVTTSFPAYQFMVASDAFSPEWLAASVASVAQRQDPKSDPRQLEGLKRIVTHALTPDRQSSELPWGYPLVVAVIDTPVTPPVAEDFVGVGYHFLVIPLGSLFE